ncbi:hexosaminidase [Paraoerskovia marina]|uniref:beta-N-acetylhexosaminidase n=1 Tax=Paraoerskovia marina TaxID=545619 RepID=A0A1H1LV79_9CELL|nr:family 20 glycosylhydrolase [Paraoerskovia marina]SDR78436.1 hexosaminidase [Paraoerskovia marina]
MFPVVPLPLSVTEADGSFVLSDATPVVVTDPLAAAMAHVFADDLAVETGLRLDVTSGSGAVHAGAIVCEVAVDDPELAALGVPQGVRADGRAAVSESYALAVTDDGVRVRGRGAEGVLRGLTVLRQLLVAAPADPETGARTLGAVRVVDSPRYAWRGLSFDVVRTFHDVATVRRVIDLLAMHRMNVLHLHLTDDQGWRIEVPARPALTEVGARGAVGDRRGGFYTVEDLRGLVRYAAARRVAIVPEIDVPGHSAAMLAAYPELLGDRPATAGERADGEAGQSTLDPDLEATWAVLSDVLDTVVDVFPSRYVHIGGDEAVGMPDDVHAAFVTRFASEVVARGRRVVGWQEASRGLLGPDALAQHWIDFVPTDGTTVDRSQFDHVDPALLDVLVEMFSKAPADVGRTLDQGTRAIVSPTAHAYLDRQYSAPSDDPAQEADRARLGLPAYAPGTVEDFYSWEPSTAVHALPAEAVAGVEAAIWCESVTDARDLDLLLLPRLAGLAERAWSPAGASSYADHATRVAAVAPAWETRGHDWFRAL